MANLIHRLWLGPTDMPRHYVQYGVRLAELNPSWVVNDWLAQGVDVDYGDTTPGNYQLRQFDPQILMNEKVWHLLGNGAIAPVPMDPRVAIATQRADLAGYELIYRYGGVYLNCDIEPLRPLSEIAAPLGAAWAGYEDDYYLNNGAIGGPAFHPFWGTVIQAIPARLAEMPNDPMNVTTGPHLLTTVLQQWRREGLDTAWGHFHCMPRHIFHFANFVQVPLGGDASAFRDEALKAGAIGLHHWGHRGQQ